MVENDNSTAAYAARHIEKRLDEFITNANSKFDDSNRKLDTLIEITRNLAVLSERQLHQAEEIQKLYKLVDDKEKHYFIHQERLEERMIKYETVTINSVDRIHKRIDDLDRMDESILKKSTENITIAVEKLVNSIKEVDDKVETLNADYNQRISFWKGVFAAFAISISLIQAMGYKYITDYEGMVQEIKSSSQKNDNRVSELEQQINLIQSNIKRAATK